MTAYGAVEDDEKEIRLLHFVELLLFRKKNNNNISRYSYHYLVIRTAAVVSALSLH